ncbi:MAG: hypothetical protein CL596_09890 [Alteromonas sp.]|nr:hypothetical protein [Alteromonas sp.]MAY22207.1 hypothetical protein [Flavobacteriaceae bacterium]|tara:strand:- start:92220 stop:92768 length:549 start_codon:yes stop_codon:yes gene_type:complete
MKQNDTIENLFENLQGNFDLADAPSGHEKRFLEKLQAQEQLSTSKKSWWKPLSIAASVVLLATLGWFSFTESSKPSDLASVSPEMEQAQSFFINTINQEIETLKSFEDEDTKKLVEDALTSLDVLEKDYEQLKLDLVESGNDKRVIAAMITNFQSRIEILQQVINTLEEIKTLKANKNETII